MCRKTSFHIFGQAFELLYEGIVTASPTALPVSSLWLVPGVQIVSYFANLRASPAIMSSASVTALRQAILYLRSILQPSRTMQIENYIKLLFCDTAPLAFAIPLFSDIPFRSPVSPGDYALHLDTNYLSPYPSSSTDSHKYLSRYALTL